MARKPQEDPQLDMTPMIDVVFELIIFFVVTIKPQDVFSRLNVNRPAPAQSSAEQTNDPIEEIQVGEHFRSDRKGVYVYNNKPYDIKTIDPILKKISSVSSDATIVVRCNGKSPHGALVDLLDICYKYKLMNVSVFSM